MQRRWGYTNVLALAQEQSKIEEKSDGSDKFSACSFMFRANFHVLYLS